MENKELIIDKIRKLLKLATSKNENEAQTAMLMAQKYMAMHNIEMSQVEDAPIDHDVIEEKADKKAHRTKWKRSLASVIANNFRCDIYYKGHGNYSTLFVGKKDDIDICKTVYQSAVMFIDKNFSEYWNNEGKWVTEFDLFGDPDLHCRVERPLSDSIRMKDSYARGFIKRLRQRFEEQKVVAEKEGWGLVLVKDTDVVEYMQQKTFTGSLSSSSVNGIDSDAFTQGYKDCNNKFGETGIKKVEG